MGGQNQTYCFHEPRVSERLFGRLCRREKGSDRQVRGSPGGQRRNMIAIFLVLLKNVFSPFKSDPKHFFLLESCFASPQTTWVREFFLRCVSLLPGCAGGPINGTPFPPESRSCYSILKMKALRLRGY